MGYEVLDSGGAAGPSGPAPPIARDAPVVDLDDGPRRPAAAPPRARRTTPRRTVGLVALALVVGGLMGSALVRQQTSLRDTRLFESTLAVAAQATEVAPFSLPIGVGAQLQVLVRNLGPAPVDVIASDRTRSDTSGTREALVTLLGASTTVASGTSARVEMRVPIDCRPGRSTSARLPVRTVDGVRHDVPVTLPDDGRPTLALCPRLPRSSALEARLTGTVLLPMLELSNLSERPLRVELPRQALVPQTANFLVRVVPRPQLPTTIRPHDQLTVHLRFIARSCVAELQDLQRLDLANLAVTATELTPSGEQAGGHLTVDVAAVVAAAMVRTCG